MTWTEQQARQFVRLVYVAHVESRDAEEDWQLARDLAAYFGLLDPGVGYPGPTDAQQDYYWPLDSGPRVWE